jgi:signal transduction histidine kinase
MSDYVSDIQVVTATHPSERRLIRLALDLHDGPLQEVAALLSDLRLFRAQLEETLASDRYRRLLLGRVDDLEARLQALDGELRGLVQDSDSSELFIVSFREAIQDQVGEFVLDAGIRASLNMRGDFDLLTRSQRIAILRVVHEGLTNTRKHSGAAEVDITISIDDEGVVQAEICDDGSGFDVERALIRAAREGRLGLVGMAERVRLLGGTLDIDSRPGGPTEISLSLPAWRGGGEVDSAAPEAA